MNWYKTTKMAIYFGDESFNPTEQDEVGIRNETGIQRPSIQHKQEDYVKLISMEVITDAQSNELVSSFFTFEQNSGEDFSVPSESMNEKIYKKLMYVFDKNPINIDKHDAGYDEVRVYNLENPLLCQFVQEQGSLPTDIIIKQL